jgi:hypothetical protein
MCHAVVFLQMPRYAGAKAKLPPGVMARRQWYVVKPATIVNSALNFTTSKTVKRIWIASPDLNYGASADVPFTQRAGQVTFSVPSLQYWDMVVVEY